MKTVPSWFLVPAVAVGFGLAWLAKPETATPPEASPGPGSKVARDRPAEPPEGRGTGGKVQARSIVVGGDASERSPEMREAQDRMATAMDERQRQQDEKRIAELVAALGLDAGQEAELRAFFDKRRRAMTGMWGGGDPEKAMEAMKPSQLDEMLGELLSPEQQRAYDELKETQRGREVDALALRDLASMTRAVDLRPDQRDAVYEILHQDAGERIDRRAESGQGAMMSVMGDGVAFEMNDELFDFGETMEELGRQAGEELGPSAGEAPDEQVMIRRMREAMQQRIDRQVARFEGVLDEAQLAKYRGSLESRSSFFDAMIEAGE